MDEAAPVLPNRKQVRLREFDYSSPGAYFITICCDDMKHLFGTVSDGIVLNNRLGRVAGQELYAIQAHHNACVDTLVVMPNHIHAIVFIDPKQHVESLLSTGGPRSAPTATSMKRPSLAILVKLYKQAVTRAIRAILSDSDFKVWQRGYYEHVIRDEDDLNIRRQYILNNPLRWTLISSPGRDSSR